MKKGSKISLPLSARMLDFRHDCGMKLAAEFERAKGVVFARFLEWS